MTADEFIEWLYEEDVIDANPDGTILKKRGKKWQALTGTIDNGGYIRVNIQHKGIRKNLRAHRVAHYCFTLESLDGMTVNHKNFNPLDNHFGNLELLSNEENAGIKKPKKL